MADANQVYLIATVGIGNITSFLHVCNLFTFICHLFCFQALAECMSTKFWSCVQYADSDGCAKF